VTQRSANGAKDATLSRKYRVQEFARLTGVTVKALRHYDRLGLLTPARTSVGHRAYSTRDRERLRQILALKRVGVPLTRMRRLLDADAAALITHLRARREELAREQECLVRADRALALVEETLPHRPDDGMGLSRLADVIDAPREAAAMTRYFSDDAWAVAKRFYEDWPTPDWIPLFRDIAAAIPEGPGSARAKDLLHRWNTLAQSLWREMTCDPGLSRKLHDGFRRAWKDREHWPEVLQRRFADYRMNEVAAFFGNVSIAIHDRGEPLGAAPKRDEAPQIV
jgi:DNA-binding transcriptional MerR regulator